MRKALAFIALILFIVACEKEVPYTPPETENPDSDTDSTEIVLDPDQVIVPGPDNSKETYDKPYVILISSDGMRYDYMKKFDAEHLLQFAEGGVWAQEGMYPCFPSSTFPNHYSLVTGLYPSHHGIVNNTFYDPERDETFSIGSKNSLDGSWYGGLPLWGLAENQGMRSACLFWVGSETDAGGNRPSYYYPYDEVSADRKIQIIKRWLTLPKEKRPHFITLYFPEVDHVGHSYGTESFMTEKQVHYVDNAIQNLYDTLSTLSLPINYVFVSDHGMINIDDEDCIGSWRYFDEDKFTVVNSMTMIALTADDTADIIPLYEDLTERPHRDYAVYLAENTPPRLNYSSHEDTTRKIGDILLIPKGAHIFADPDWDLSPGFHGFNPYRVPEMKATFLAWGPAFKENMKVPPFLNVHIYPLIAEILGLDITAPIDGKLGVLKSTLVE